MRSGIGSLPARKKGVKYQIDQKEVVLTRGSYYLKNKENVKQYYRDNKELIKQNYLKRGEAIKQYYITNKDDIKKVQKQYYLKNKINIQQYYLQNKHLIREKQMQYILKNKQTIQAFQSQYRLKNKENLKLIRLNNKHNIKQYYLNNKEHIIETQKQYRLNNKENIKEAQKQYRIKNKDAIQIFQKQYRLNHKDAIQKLQKQYWLKRKTKRKSKIWTDPAKIASFFEYAREQLYINEINDWYRISHSQIRKMGGGALYSIFGNLGKALEYTFPDVNWDQSKFSFRGKKSTQRWLRVILQQILPDTDVIEDFLHPQLFWDDKSRHKMELDIWIPQYQIALEYQGEHHYHDLFSAYGPSGTLALYSQRDLKKREACSKQDITLVTIPY